MRLGLKHGNSIYAREGLWQGLWIEMRPNEIAVLALPSGVVMIASEDGNCKWVYSGCALLGAYRKRTVEAPDETTGAGR